MMLGSLRRKTVSIMVSTILLVLTTIASSVVLYHWISTQSDQISMSEKSTNMPVIIVEKTEAFRGHVEVFVRNIGKEPYTIDRIYVYNRDGQLVSTGQPVTPDNYTKLNPGDVKAILFYVGVLPDGTYKVSLGGHGSPEAGVSAGKIELKLTSGIPPLVITEVKDTALSVPARIEIFNPTNSPLNISYFEFEYNDDNNLTKIFRIISANPINYTTPNSSMIYIKGLVPQTIIIEPKSYMVINLTGNPSPPYFHMFNDYGKMGFRIYVGDDVIDDTGNFTTYGWTVYSIQRVDLHIYPRWILSSPNFGEPNNKVGVNANT